MAEFFTLTTLYFLLISIVNVILSTIRSLATVRYGRLVNIFTNVISYSFYTVVVKSVADMPLLVTVIGTAIANALGVWLSYIILDHLQKDRLWCIQATVRKEWKNVIDLNLKDIPHNFIEVGGHTLFNFYCETQAQSKKVKDVCSQYSAKFCAFESKVL